jgi:translation elongation factor EF-4
MENYNWTTLHLYFTRKFCCFSFPLWFLGMLHMEIIQRLERNWHDRDY